jgi:replicative DNA helicase
VQNPTIVGNDLPALVPLDFGISAHQQFFVAVQDLWQAGLPIDKVHIAEKVAKLEKRPKDLTENYIADICEDSVPMGLHVDYFKLIRDKRILRTAMSYCGKLSEKAMGFGVGDSMDTFLDWLETSALKIRKARESQLSFKDGAEVLAQELIGLQEYLANPTPVPRGIMTGIPDIDNIVRGLRPGMMTVLAARPSAGKTALMLQIALHAARVEGAPVGIFSLEMPAEDLMQRAASHLSGVSWLKVENAMVTAEQRARFYSAKDLIAKGMLVIDDTPDMPIEEIRSRGRQMVVKHGVKLIAMDYMQMVKKDPNLFGEEKAAAISTGTKNMLRELEVPGLILAQFNRDQDKREKEQKAPRMSDLRESGKIEADADQIWAINRPWGNDNPHMDLFSLKGRNTGLFDPVEMQFDGELQRAEMLNATQPDLL